MEDVSNCEFELQITCSDSGAGMGWGGWAVDRWTW